jgi:hypothetical protein
VIYANSVFGARSNFEAGPAALAAALTGRTPRIRLSFAGKQNWNFFRRTKSELNDLADWGAVGKLVGESHQSYYAVPVFHGYQRIPAADELKHLGAALASYGSMAMFSFRRRYDRSSSTLPKKEWSFRFRLGKRLLRNYSLVSGCRLGRFRRSAAVAYSK